MPEKKTLELRPEPSPEAVGDDGMALSGSMAPVTGPLHRVRKGADVVQARSPGVSSRQTGVVPRANTARPRFMGGLRCFCVSWHAMAVPHLARRCEPSVRTSRVCRRRSPDETVVVPARSRTRRSGERFPHALPPILQTHLQAPRLRPVTPSRHLRAAPSSGRRPHVSGLQGPASGSVSSDRFRHSVFPETPNA